MDKGADPFLIGAVPAFVILAIYKFTINYLPIKINKSPVHIPVIPWSFMNGVFIVILFATQKFIPVIPYPFYEAVFGFVSVMIAFFVMIVANNVFSRKKTSPLLALYAGIFEFFILPLMFVFYGLQENTFVNGFVSGLIGGAIALCIVNKILKKNPLTLMH
ncbi:MAG TPA: hypothetical protein VKE88_01640 [Candidatus Nanoarchaeia archaeon]|nr:hypothetical protein [Candidatus Nanoarchaeia archaeon]